MILLKLHQGFSGERTEDRRFVAWRSRTGIGDLISVIVEIDLDGPNVIANGSYGQVPAKDRNRFIMQGLQICRSGSTGSKKRRQNGHGDKPAAR